MRAVFLIGRAIFGGFFVWNGLNHWRQQESMSQYAAAKGVPAADVAVPASGTLILAGGASVLAGFQPRLGLAAIIGFLIPVSLQMHRFWEIEDPAEQMPELVNFAKNMALLGAALMLMQLDEPWPASVDELRAEDEEMYVRLGGRDLRALPA
jgi:putative oxidoreductase